MSSALDAAEQRKNPSMCRKIKHKSRNDTLNHARRAVDHQSPLVSDMCSVLEPRRDNVLVKRA